MKLCKLFEVHELFIEFRWYSEFIEEHELDLSIELKNGKLLIYRSGKILVQWTAVEAYDFRTMALSSSSNALLNIKKSPLERGLNVLLLPIIATNPTTAHTYATTVSRRKFELGEKAIATVPVWALSYASMLKKRFPLGEPAIATNSSLSYAYAKKFGRFELGEPAIATNPQWRVSMQ